MLVPTVCTFPGHDDDKMLVANGNTCYILIKVSKKKLYKVMSLFSAAHIQVFDIY